MKRVGGAAYSYDAQGNLTSDGARSFSYNLANQLTAATTGSGSATITYDPLGRLQQVGAASTTRYLYDGAMLVAEYNTAGTMLRRYVPGQGVDETLSLARARGVHRSKPSAGRFCRPAANRSSRYEGADLSSPHWLHTDQQGSVIAATDSSATATPYAYSVTGEPKGGWSSSAPAFRYTGQIAIASAALYFYKARMYDPALGRFLQTDPTGYSAGMNLYAYVGNDPVNRVDPSGQFQVCIPGWDITVAEEGHEATVHMPTVCQDYPDSILAPLPPPSIPPSKDSPPGNGANNQPQFCPIAYTPHGDTVGNNPVYGGGGYKTDLPGGWPEAIQDFRLLSWTAQDTKVIGNIPGRPDILARSYPSGIQLRAPSDGRPRIDIPANTARLSIPETIHFNQKANTCPVP